MAEEKDILILGPKDQAAVESRLSAAQITLESLQKIAVMLADTLDKHGEIADGLSMLAQVASRQIEEVLCLMIQTGEAHEAAA